MDQLPFLHRLTLQLIAGASLLPEDMLAPHRSYVIQAQGQDGGWSGREGSSDLYYTGFALRTLAILGELKGQCAQRASSYLRGSLTRSQSVVDLISLLYGAQLISAATDIDPFAGFGADWRSRVVGFFDTLRRNDGGFAKAPESKLGSSYQTFLVVLCRQLLELPIAANDPCIQFLEQQRQQDGGYLEVRVAKRSGTNPTAAAAVALNCLGSMTPDVRNAVCGFLLDMQTDGGGFAANQRMPMEDMLSTFTALVTLWELERIEDADVKSANQYALSMARPAGGFGGFALDPAQDVEYTFYGLSTLALAAHYIN